MLPRDYRFIAHNVTGQTQTYASGARVNVQLHRWKLDSDGALSFEGSESEVELLTTGNDVADDATVTSADQDNATNKYLGAWGIFRVKTNHASTAGSFDLYLEHSTDDATSWPSDQTDFDVTRDAFLLVRIRSMTSTRNEVEVPFEI